MDQHLRHILFGAVVLLGGCTSPVGPEHKVPQLDLPTQWNSLNCMLGKNVSRNWWEAFQDAELNRLQTLALLASPDLAKAMARVDEARATQREITTTRFPVVTGNSGLNRSQQSTHIAQMQTQEVTTYHSQADLNSEIDLWGKIRRQIEASTANTDAIILNGQAVRLRLVSQVAESYLVLRGLEAEMDVLRDSLRLRQTDVVVTAERQVGGLTSKADISRAYTELATTKAEITDLQRRYELSLHGLAALCGQPASGFSVKAHRHHIPSFVPHSPATLLSQRPDIAEAERVVAIRSAEIGVAEANRLPRLTLNGSLGLESLSLSDLVSRGSTKFSFGPQIDLPIFNAGALKAKSAQAQARHAQAVADYQNTVLIALKEVEDALTNTRSYAALSTGYEVAVEVAEQAAQLIRERYNLGSSGYLEVTEAQRDVLTYRRRLAQSRSHQALAAVELAKALGGGGMQ